MDKKVKKWYEASRKLNWHATDSQKVRRQNALNSRNRSLIKTAQALQALSNVQHDKDSAVARKAQTDATHFFTLYKASKNKR